MARLDACLLDAYDTIVTCDFSALREEVPALAGISADTWHDEYNRIGPWLTDGRMSKAQGFGRILQTCGVQARPDLVREMVRLDEELLLANGRLFDDVIPFLERLRARGIKIAVVSNCAENTRPLLVSLGVDALADALVLSCEVGVAKPARRIYEILFERTGLRPEELLFVDDSLANVAAAEALGMAAIHYREGIDLDAELRARGVLG